jgi:hypothetical protein
VDTNSKIIAGALGVAIIIISVSFGLILYKVVENSIWVGSLSSECRILLEEADQKFAEVCR